jgi:hypothetical protein
MLLPTKKSWQVKIAFKILKWGGYREISISEYKNKIVLNPGKPKG